jgi:transcription initiation factor TFIID subunit 2
MRDFSTLGSYPFSTFKMVFVDEPSPQCAISAGMTVLSSDLLYPPEVIDQAFITRPILSHALATQWLGINIIPRSYADLWLVNGLASYINALFLKTLMGNSEYRYKLRMEIEKCVAMDQGDQYPISIPGARDPPDPASLEFINLKAPLVLQMLDRRMTKLGTSLGLSRVLPKLFLESLSGQLKDNQLTSAHFLKLCRKMSGVDWTQFYEQWVLGSGCPRISVSARYDRPRKVIDFIITQRVAAPKSYSSRHNMKQAHWQKPTQQFDVST